MGKLKLNNVFLSSYGYNEAYNTSEYRYSNKLEEELKKFVKNDMLNTDIESLSQVAKILDNDNAHLVCINADKTITFFDSDY